MYIERRKICVTSYDQPTIIILKTNSFNNALGTQCCDTLYDVWWFPRGNRMDGEEATVKWRLLIVVPARASPGFWPGCQTDANRPNNKNNGSFLDMIIKKKNHTYIYIIYIKWAPVTFSTKNPFDFDPWPAMISNIIISQTILHRNVY